MKWSVRTRQRWQRSEEPNDLQARLDKLQDAANTASGHARNVYVTFLLFGLYLAIIFGSTTHEQLLRESPVTLPLLSVGLPLFGFYWIAPALFVLLHLNLLLQFYLLSGKLHRFDHALSDAIDRRLIDRQRADERRAQLYPFPFSQMLVGRQHGRLMRFLLWLVVWLPVLVLPVILLLMGQVRFLPYHDPWTTMWHRFMVLADILLILIFWRAIRHPGDRLLRHPGRWLWYQAKVALPSLLVLGLSFVILTFPGDYAIGDSSVEGTRDFGDPMEEALLDDRGWLAWAYPASWRVDTPPEGGQGQPRPIFWPTEAVFRALPFLQRNLIVREANLVASWPNQGQIIQFGEDLAWQNFGAPPDLRRRDLRYADFAGSILVRGVFRDANLRGSILSGANLQSADLMNANLQGASLEQASLQSAQLLGADLPRTHLFGADLKGATIIRANFQGADLAVASLQGALIVTTDFQGARLIGADLRGAALTNVKFGGAVLRGADLRGASLGDPKWDGGVSMVSMDAELRGNDIFAHFLSVFKNDLQGADLRGAHVWRAHLHEGAEPDNSWFLADLRGVDVDPIEDLDDWIEEAIQQIVEQSTRNRVAQRLQNAFKDEDRPKVPTFPEGWRAASNILFDAGDPLPQQLGWETRHWPTVDAYDRELVTYLSVLVCGSDATAHIAGGVAERVLWDRNRPYAKRLAARLIGDACPPAAELPNDLRRRLEQLAAGSGARGSENARP